MIEDAARHVALIPPQLVHCEHEDVAPAEHVSPLQLGVIEGVIISAIVTVWLCRSSCIASSRMLPQLITVGHCN